MGRRSAAVGRLWAAVAFVLFSPMPQDYVSLSARQSVAAITTEADQRPSGQSTGWTQPTPSIDKPSTVKATILVYHHLGPSLSTGSRSERRLTVTPEVFDKQMGYLKDNGYHVITFSDVEDSLKHGSVLPEKSVVISFDDGWQEQFKYALPVLQKYHFSATFFVVAGFVGSPGFLSWNELKTLHAEGMTIGSHSRSHPYLSRIHDRTVLWDQIYNSKEVIETRLGVRVDHFAYPYGAYNSTTSSTVREAGYKTARACCVGGALADAYGLKSVMAPSDLDKFVRYLGGTSAIPRLLGLRHHNR